MAGQIELVLDARGRKNFAPEMEQQVVEEIQPLVHEVGRDFIQEITTYPGEGPGNAPPTPYWERGTGRILADGSVSPASQRFNQSWTMETHGAPFQLQVTLRSRATYAAYLVDDQLQTPFHKRTGWKTIRQVQEKTGVSARGLINHPAVLRAVNRIRARWRRILARRG